ncbi:pyridoxal-phosphate dependent enzyme [Gaopeijia maritima]|uniref:threonine ammonia-lyase n=1 Tax=Gaopeijia maritima TaxID=3119007 RepID=UPI00324BA36B
MTDPSTAFDWTGALARVRAVIPPSPVVGAPTLCARLDRPVHLKLECLNETGSFKVRGAAARIQALGDEDRARGVVTCSSGNHGRAVAFVAERLGVPATVFVPDWVDPVKLAAIRAHRADAVLAGDSYDEAERRALEHAAARGLTFVPPFDDADVVAGQGTVALETLEQVPGVTEIAAPLSGGGLIGGIAAALRDHRPAVAVTAVTAHSARVMWESLRAGRPIEMPEDDTLAGALAGGIGLDNRVTFPLVRDLVAHHEIVDEAAIALAMAYAWHELGLVLEGGGAVALAAALEGLLPGDSSDPLVIVLSGGNVDLGVLGRVLAGNALAVPDRENQSRSPLSKEFPR